jgi:uroporphyrinogen decarboxylase
MTKERVNAILRERADLPDFIVEAIIPIRHGVPDSAKRCGTGTKYDWDYVKINPRAVYYHEAWGNEYDYTRYNDVIPTRVKTVVNQRSDLEKIQVLPGDQGVFAEQLEAVRKVIAGLNGEVPVFQTVFTPIGILLNLCGMRSLGRYRELPAEGSPVIQMLQEDGRWCTRR